MTHPYGFDYRIEQEYLDRYQFGFVTLYNGTQQTTISFDGSNVFTIAPTGTTWSYYRNGTRCEVTGSKTVLLKSPSGPADKGLYFIYIDALDGTLTASTSPWTLEDTLVPVATIAWDNTLTPKYHLSNERHSCAISRRYHFEHHFADGTELMLTPTLDGPVVAPSGPADTDNVMGISASRAADEDIKITLDALTKPNGTDAVYTTFYRGSGVWSWASSAMPYKYGTYIQYDSSGTMTDLGSGDFVNVYLLVTNIDGQARYSFMHGQAKFATLAAAQAETFSSLNKTGLPIAEFVAVYQFTWSTLAAYTTKGKCRLAAAPKPINVSASGASFGAATVWGTITGTIANQADLVAELALKANLAGGNAFTGAQSITGTTSTDQPTYSAEFLAATGWTSTDWTGDFATGWTHTTGNTSVLSQSTAAVSSTRYQIAYTVTGRTAGTFTVSFGGQVSEAISATGAFGPISTSTASLTIAPTTDFNGTIVVSVKSITDISTALVSLRSSSGSMRTEIRVNTGNHTTFIGTSAGRYNTTGSYNTAVGVQSLYNNTTGRYSTSVGVQSLYANTTGLYNVGFGDRTLYSNVSGNNNVAIGSLALYANAASNNTAVGSNAQRFASTGSANSSIGFNSLFSLTTGSYNSAIGYGSGRYISGGLVANQTSNNSVYLGYNAQALADGDTNEIVIGYAAIGAGSNTITLGNTSITKTILRGNALLGTTTDGMTAGGSLAIAQDLAHRGSKAGFYNTTPAAKPTVTGSRGGNAALASLLTALAGLGLITDSTSA